jgi:hypothetical protein
MIYFIFPHKSSLGAFAKVPKATISLVMSVRLSLRMEKLGSHWTEFYEICNLTILIIFIVYIYGSISDKFRQTSRENQNAHFEFHDFLSRKSCHL